MTRLSFTAAPALFALLAAVGLWLAWKLYFGSNLPLGARARHLLALLTAAAWLALAWFGAGPLLNRNPAIYHPPAVVLALDESPSHASLGARERAREPLRAARAHYAAQGFEVIELGFAEAVAKKKVTERTATSGEARREGRDESLGELTSFRSLALALDSLRIPNLQAVVLASDGRATVGDLPASWPAPVYPLRFEGEGEAQGESAELDWTRAAEGAALTVTWSAHGVREVSVELRDGARTVWKGMLAAGDVATEWTPTVSEFRLPPSPASANPENWTLLVRPALNPLAANDTVDLRIRGLNRARDLLLRPLVSLEERGLVDALMFGDSGAVSVLEPSLVEARTGDVVWTRAGRAPPAGAANGGAAVIEYFPARDSGGGFGAEARVFWREDGAEFLPAGVLRLGDLGVSRLDLKPPGTGAEALAWVEQGGKKGLLFWREPGSRAFGLALPPLWKPGFSAGSGPRWIRGASEWARAHGRARAFFPDPAVAGRAFALEARFPAGDADFKNAARYDLTGEGGRVLGSARGAASARFDSVSLTAGVHRLAVKSVPETGPETGGRIVWQGVVRARSPRGLEAARLGPDVRALAAIASVSNGNIIDHENNLKISWPVLPGGQARETRARALPLAPAAIALIAALLLCAAWALRKRFQVD